MKNWFKKYNSTIRIVAMIAMILLPFAMYIAAGNGQSTLVDALLFGFGINMLVIMFL